MGVYFIAHEHIMRVELIKIACCTMLIIVALLALSMTNNSEPGATISFGVAVCSFVFCVFCVRNLIYLALLSQGVIVSENTIFMHMCAAAMAGFAYNFGFCDPDPRIGQGKWFFLFFMPLSVYIVSYCTGRTTYSVFWLFSLMFEPKAAPKRKARSKKTLPKL